MSDRRLRELEHAASCGDVSAMLASARLLIRLDRSADALNWLNLAGDDPQVNTELKVLLAESLEDPLLLTRIACTGHVHALERIAANFPDLHALRVATGHQLEGAIQRLLKSSRTSQLAALHTAFERLTRGFSQQEEVRGLALKVLRRKRTWDQADLVGLARWLCGLSYPEVLPWSTLLTTIAKSVTADSVNEPLLKALKASERHFDRQGIHHGETLRFLRRIRILNAQLQSKSDDPW